jgi:ABC-type protease/lipase transport system fused ATPase/permease subunit
VTDKEVPAGENESKGTGFSKLAKAWIVVIGLMVFVLILEAFDTRLGIVSMLGCLVQISIAALIVVSVVQWLQKKTLEQRPEHQIAQTPEAQGIFRQAEHLLSQGKREEAVTSYLQAYHEGSPAIRKQAVTALKNLGEIEEF